MLTAETITDAQIRELREAAKSDPNSGLDELVVEVCERALEMKPDKRNARSVMRARARCAEILTARNGR